MDLKAGNLDVAFGVPVAQFNALKSEPGITAKPADQKYLVELAFNTYASPNSQGNPVLQDVKFRQAVSWAVDKEKIVATCMGGYADVGQSVLVPSTDDAWTPTAAETFGYDPEKAKQLLDAAGYKDTQRRRHPRGQAGQADQAPPVDAQKNRRSSSAPVSSSPGRSSRSASASTLEVMNDGSISDGIWTYKGSTYAPDYDLFIWGWSGNIDPDYMLADFITSQIEMWNDCCWSNKEYDSLYLQQASEMDAAKRKDRGHAHAADLLRAGAVRGALLPQGAHRLQHGEVGKAGCPTRTRTGSSCYAGDNIDSYRLVHPVTATTGSSSGTLEHDMDRDRRRSSRSSSSSSW